MKTNKKEKLNKLVKTSRPFFFKLIRWLSSNLLKIKISELTAVLALASKIFMILETRGKTQAIKYSKDLRLNLMKFLFTKDFNGSDDSTIKFPKFFKRSILSGIRLDNYPYIRLVLSILYITRFIRLEAKPSYESIEKGPGYTGTPDYLKPHVEDFLKELGVNPKYIGQIPKAIKFKEFHMTAKSGPQGHALWSSYKDVLDLPDDLIASITVVGGEKIGLLIPKFRSLLSQIGTGFFDKYMRVKPNVCLRKLATIQDKEGKTREVAILDYWSQASLMPLHNFLNKQLNRIPQDCTYNQHKLINKLVPTPGSSYHSVDLTSATDRFPIVIEQLILEVWFGEEFAKAWKHIMVGIPFRTPDGDRKIYYNTGNPMGAYSSFATFAVAHHFFIWLSCQKANVEWSRCPYMLLGDDVVIANDKVALAYKHLLVQWDIPYSEAKTHQSKVGYEFAKQVVTHNMNVSPFPLSALYERRNHWIQSIGILYSELQHKGWNCDVNIILTLVDKYLGQVQGFNSSYRNKLKPRIRLILSLTDYFHNNLKDLGNAVMDYVASWSNRKIEFSKSFNPATRQIYVQYVCIEALKRTFRESFQKITDPSNPEPLGDLATGLVIEVSSLQEPQGDVFDLIESVPFLQIYGKAEETYMKLLKQQDEYIVPTTRPIDLKSHFGKVSIPLSDKGFYVRNRDVVISDALKAANLMEDIIHHTSTVTFRRISFDLPWGDAVIKRASSKEGTPSTPG
jgi:hypothetical protein